MDHLTDDEYEAIFGATRAETDAVDALLEKYPDLNDPSWMDRVARIVVETDYDQRWNPAFVERVYLAEKRRDFPRRSWWRRLLGR